MNDILQQNKDPDQENYDLGKLFNLLIRNKTFIGFFTLITFSCSAIYSLTLRRVWEGQFEIVLNLNNKNEFGSINQEISQILDFKNIGENELNTQVGILESPSVLMPIFDYVSSIKGEPFNKEIIFSDWKKKNIKIDLKDNTSILKIAYRDNDKEIIYPVLEKISLAYQQYSGKKEKRIISITKNFLNEQIKIYKVKSKESLRKAQAYGLDKDLTSINLPSKGQIGESFEPLRAVNTDIEVMRVRAANQIKKIDFKISKIKKLSNKDYMQLQFLLSELALAEGSDSLMESLKNVEVVIRNKKKLFKENDKVFNPLYERKQLLINLLRDRVIGFLEAQRVVEEAKLKASLRPKEVLIKYNELLRDAIRNEETLIKLENNLRVVELSEAKSDDPWQLITNPTVLNTPVAPSRKRIGIIGMFLGLIFGTLVSYIKEKKSGLIYEIDYLQKITKAPIIQEINNNDLDKENWDLFSLYFKDCPKGEKSLVILIDNYEEINSDSISTIKKNIATNFSDELYKSIDFVNELEFNLEKKYFKIFLLVSNSGIQKDKIKNILKKFEYYGNCINGIIIYK